MTYNELSDQFDIQANRFSIANSSPLLVFDEYEKSLFLTKAGKQLIDELKLSYDKDESARRKLLDVTLTSTSVFNNGVLVTDGVYSNAATTNFFSSGDIIAHILQESLVYNSKVDADRPIRVLDTNSSALSINNPFRMYGTNFAYRTSSYSSAVTNILSDLNLTNHSYMVTYIKYPMFKLHGTTPSIEGDVTAPILTTQAPLRNMHQELLDRAVMLAILSKSIDPSSKINAASVSQATK